MRLGTSPPPLTYLARICGGVSSPPVHPLPMRKQRPDLVPTENLPGAVSLALRNSQPVGVRVVGKNEAGTRGVRSGHGKGQGPLSLLQLTQPQT
jgi:hypothetical protein